MKRIAAISLALGTCLGVGVVKVGAQQTTSPGRPFMQGFPPPVEQRVTRENFRFAPYNEWSFRHIRELQPTRDIYRGPGPVSELPAKNMDLETLTFSLSGDRRTDLNTWLEYSGTHSFVVLHQGRLVYERYLSGMRSYGHHNMFSVTKSYVGTLVLMLMDEGRIDPGREVADYIPELSGSAFADATVQQVLDMTVSIKFSEEYTDPKADIWRYGSIFGLGPESAKTHDSVYEFLPALEKDEHAHGEGFHYVSPKTEVLGWILNRVTGKPVSQLMAERFWQPMGMERDAYMWIDAVGGELAAGGLNTTARDAARFGQMILQGGRFNDQQVIPAAVAKRILTPGDPEVFKRFYDDPWYEEIGHSYHDQWWSFNNAHGAVSGIGIHGQFIYIDPVAQMVVVKQSAHPEAEGDANEVDGPLIWQQIAEYLMANAGNQAAGNQQP